MPMYELATTTEQLRELLSKVVPECDDVDCNELFNVIANSLIKNFAVKKGSKLYRFTDIEFYYYDSQIDDYRDDNENKKVTYPRTCKQGQWFFHNSGIDLTFNSDADKGYGGGILIRGLRKEEANKTLNGPKNCYNELYEVYEDAFSPSAPYIVASNHIEYSVKSDKRYNLNDRNNRLWRFHVVNK